MELGDARRGTRTHVLKHQVDVAVVVGLEHVVQLDDVLVVVELLRASRIHTGTTTPAMAD